mgnify:CR=1 FL=1
MSNLVLLPAVDVTDGHAVQLVQGVAGSGGQYGDPMEAALAGMDPVARRRKVQVPLPRLLDLEDERPPGPEHARVHVLPPHAVQRVAAAAGLPHDLHGNDLLHARRVHLARASALRAALPVAAVARPAGLGDSADELPVDFRLRPTPPPMLSGSRFVTPMIVFS